MLAAPRPYPDELISSALLRCCRLFHLPVRLFGRHVLGYSFWRPSFLGGSDFGVLSELFRLPAEDLLWNHTAFPYVTAMMPAEAFERCLAVAMQAPEEGGGGSALGIVFRTAFSGVPFRRYCQLCAAEERERLGHAFWHRSHNLPGVWVCLKHSVYLCETQIRLNGPDGALKVLPDECAGKALGRGRSVPAALLRFAEVSMDWLSRPRTPGTPREPPYYRQLAEANEWVSPGRPVKAEVVFANIMSLFGKRFLEHAAIPITPKRGAWPLLMLRPGVRIPFVPPKHAVMQVLLEAPSRWILPVMDHRPPGALSSPPDTLDAFYARAAKVELKRVLRDRLILTTEQFLRRVGCLSHYRRQRTNLPKLSEVVREFRGSAATVKRLKPGKTLFRMGSTPATRGASSDGGSWQQLSFAGMAADESGGHK